MGRLRAADAGRFLLLVLGAGVIAFPFVWMLLSSFKSNTEISLSPPTFLPATWHLDNYKTVWTSPPSTFGKYYLNSVILATGGAVLQTMAAVLAAYGFAQMEFPGRRFLFITFLVTMMIPAEVTLIPNFVTIRHIPFIGGNDWTGSGGRGLYDSYVGMILPSAGSAFAVFFLRQAFLNLPPDYWDAARLDGCGRFRYLWLIALPLVRPAVATMIVFAAFQYWNQLLWPLVITNSESLRPVQVAILYFQSEVDSHFNLVLAAATLSMLPGLALYFLAQRHFNEALAFSGIKG
jgi:multiple sugar transport system permease protein